MDNSISSLEQRVATVVERLFQDRSIGRLVRSEDNLSEVGLASLDLVKLVVLVEDEFDLLLPMSEITPGNFRSIASISRLMAKMLD